MRDKYLWTGVALVGIWLTVVFASIFSPDLVTGSEQEHIPIAAVTQWLWGATSSGFVLMVSAVRRESGVSGHYGWRMYGASVAGIWLAAMFVSIFGPRTVTGSDPTRLPLAAIISPVIATFATAFASVAAAGRLAE
jgi:hypothetical protein